MKVRIIWSWWRLCTGKLYFRVVLSLWVLDGSPTEFWSRCRHLLPSSACGGWGDDPSHALCQPRHLGLARPACELLQHPQFYIRFIFSSHLILRRSNYFAFFNRDMVFGSHQGQLSKLQSWDCHGDFGGESPEYASIAPNEPHVVISSALCQIL